MYIHSGDFKLRTMMNDSDSRLSFGFRGKSMMSGSSSTTTSCDAAPWQHGSGRWVTGRLRAAPIRRRGLAAAKQAFASQRGQAALAASPGQG